MKCERDERAIQVMVGVGILLALALVVGVALTGWRSLPGLLGEWVGVMVGVASTPFFLEATFFVLGLVIVVAVNHWRQRRDGDEWVSLQGDAEAAAGNLKVDGVNVNDRGERE